MAHWVAVEILQIREHLQDFGLVLAFEVDGE
jgi:hypothetical protein